MTIAPPLARDTAESTTTPTGQETGSARISFRQPVSASGYVDAAWWPRQADLTAELPALLEVVWTAGREITHVTYNLTMWEAAPRRLRVQNRMVRLGGFATSDPLTIRLTDSAGQERIDVLVVPPATDPSAAHRALMLAAVADSPYTAAEIMSLATGATAAASGMTP